MRNRLAGLVVLLAIGVGTASARGMRAWTYRELHDAADVVAIVTPAKTRMRPEQAPLPDLVETRPGGKQVPVLGQRVETELEVTTILKGKLADPRATRIVLAPRDRSSHSRRPGSTPG